MLVNTPPNIAITGTKKEDRIMLTEWIMLSLDILTIRTLPAKIKIIWVIDCAIFSLYIDWKFDWAWIIAPDKRNNMLLKIACTIIWKSGIKLSDEYVAKNI